MRDEEEEEQEEALQHCQKMPRFHLLQVEGRRGGRGKEDVVGRRKSKPGEKAQLEKCLPYRHRDTSLSPKHT